MIMQFLSTSIKQITTLALVGIVLAMPTGSRAGSCCGGGGGGSLILPKTAISAVSMDTAWEKYDGYYDLKSDWRPDPPDSDLSQYRVSLALAQRLGADWQGSLNLPYVWNRNRYSAVDSTTEGMGDASVAVTYETFKSPSCVTKISRLKDLTPSIYIGTGLLIPTGVSPYDDVDNSFDITGRGFYRADLNIMIDKSIFPWTFTLNGGTGHHFERKVNREYGRYVEPYKKQLGNTRNGSVAVGYTWDLPWEATTGMTLITTITYSDRHEDKATINGITDETSGLRKRSVGLSTSLLSFADDWALTLGYTTSRPSDDWGNNCPATDIFSLGVKHVFY
ncbi:MAG: hypothetical protein KKG47_10700 [Proteobacteria bacterium]|nr:hypothetical protein [Pseudomonadota bacterium]MBU1738573.1 hypothetical protein [Pseudomonadota bacterium]